MLETVLSLHPQREQVPAESFAYDGPVAPLRIDAKTLSVTARGAAPLRAKGTLPQSNTTIAALATPDFSRMPDLANHSSRRRARIAAQNLCVLPWYQSLLYRHANSLTSPWQARLNVGGLWLQSYFCRNGVLTE